MVYQLFIEVSLYIRWFFLILFSLLKCRFFSLLLCNRYKDLIIVFDFSVENKWPNIENLFGVRYPTSNRSPYSKSCLYLGIEVIIFLFILMPLLRLCTERHFLSKLLSFLKVVFKTFILNKMHCRFIILLHNYCYVAVLYAIV